MRGIGIMVCAAALVGAGFFLMISRPVLPNVPSCLGDGAFVGGLEGMVFCLICAAYLLRRWLGTGRGNPLTFVWGVSFLGLSFSFLGIFLSGLGLVRRHDVGCAFSFGTGELVWCCGMLAGAMYVFSPRRRLLWALVPLAVMAGALSVLAWLCRSGRGAAEMRIVKAFFVVAPTLALTAHAFDSYLRLRRAVFARLLYSGLVLYMAAAAVGGAFPSGALTRPLLPVYNISLALMLGGFIYMRIETADLKRSRR